MIAVLKDLLGRVVPLEGNETKAPRLVIMWIAHHKNLVIEIVSFSANKVAEGQCPGNHHSMRTATTGPNC